MSTDKITNFENYLNGSSEPEWFAAVESLLLEMHPVDRNATQIWFRFYPLSLRRYIDEAPEQDDAVKGLAIQGGFGLEDKIDTSHSFLYGHRYWKSVKAAIEDEAEVFENANADLADEIRRIAKIAAEKVKADTSLLVGITAVGLMTLNQVGLDRFKAPAGEPVKPSGLMAKSPDAIVAERKKDDSQGLLGFLKTVDKKFSIRYDENSVSGKFEIMNDQQISAASANDRSQNWQAKDARCWEGPVPVECTSASCGTCWVGVIAGQDKLSEVSRRERRAMKLFGYNQPGDEKPFLRLACQAKAFGNATIVIPPWNGVFGKKVYGNVEELELEPVTTSAKALREVVRTASATEGSE